MNSEPPEPPRIVVTVGEAYPHRRRLVQRLKTFFKWLAIIGITAAVLVLGFVLFVEYEEHVARQKREARWGRAIDGYTQFVQSVSSPITWTWSLGTNAPSSLSISVVAWPQGHLMAAWDLKPSVQGLLGFDSFSSESISTRVNLNPNCKINVRLTLSGNKSELSAFKALMEDEANQQRNEGAQTLNYATVWFYESEERAIPAQKVRCSKIVGLVDDRPGTGGQIVAYELTGEISGWSLEDYSKVKSCTVELEPQRRKLRAR
jgi:hypothetical protein